MKPFKSLIAFALVGAMTLPLASVAQKVITAPTTPKKTTESKPANSSKKEKETPKKNRGQGSNRTKEPAKQPDKAKKDRPAAESTAPQQAPVPTPAPPAPVIEWDPQNIKFVYGDKTYNLIYVPGGEFVFENTPKSERSMTLTERTEDVQGHLKSSNTSTTSTRPDIVVKLDGFYIGDTEVPQWLWQRVMGDNPSRHGGEDCPVVNVSWYDCVEFISFLNEKFGTNFTLPSEYQWEYAAIGGPNAHYTLYSGSDNIAAVAWTEGDGVTRAQPVRGKRPNLLGLYDMSGNVYEWCSTWFDPNYRLSTYNVNPPEPSNGQYKIMRGGCYDSSPDGARCCTRSMFSPSDDSVTLGFRLCMPK